MILVDFTNSTTERNGLYVNYYGYYATITSVTQPVYSDVHKWRAKQNLVTFL